MACFAAGAFAGTDSLTLINAGAGYGMGGVYTSPYGISINGAAATSLICDDFLTNISIGQTWSAIETSLADLQAHTNPAGTPKFDPGNPATAAEIRNYATAAVLAQQLMSLNNLASEAAGELSYAIWGIFDTGLLTSNPVSGEGHLDATQLAMARQYLTDARGVVDSVTNDLGVIDLNQLPNLTIYTPSAPNGLASSQEFLRVSMAEPSYPAVLAVDLLAVIGLMVIFRRRVTGLFN